MVCVSKVRVSWIQNQVLCAVFTCLSDECGYAEGRNIMCDANPIYMIMCS